MKKVLSVLGCLDGEVSILLTDDRHMAQLNKDYLGKDGPTNVLAFPMSGEPGPRLHSGMLGDVAVSVDSVISESQQLGEPLEQRLYALLIHGILHLLDYDHEGSREQAKVMEKEEERLLAMMREE
jgi:rRNA maturation RNase YbeY